MPAMPRVFGKGKKSMISVYSPGDVLKNISNLPSRAMPSPERQRNASVEILPSSRRMPLETGNFGQSKQRMTNVVHRLPVQVIGTSGMPGVAQGMTIGSIAKAASSLSYLREQLHLNTLKSFTLTHNSSMRLDQGHPGDDYLESSISMNNN
jgi:hypothetical protein